LQTISSTPNLFNEKPISVSGPLSSGSLVWACFFKMVG